MADCSILEGGENATDEDLLNYDFEELINILGKECGIEEEISIICEEVRI